MAERIVDTVFVVLAFLVLLLIVLLVSATLFGETNAAQSRSGNIGSPGVVKAEAIVVKEAGRPVENVVLLKLEMVKVIHEEGKNIDAVPVITILDVPYRPYSKQERGDDYPSYKLPTDILGYFAIQYRTPEFLDHINNGGKIHVSLWEKSCLDKIGFKETTAATIGVVELFKKCQNSYLGAWEIKPEMDSDEINVL